jgi:hypothetical protein
MALQHTPMTSSPALTSLPPSTGTKPLARKKSDMPGGSSLPFWVGLSVSIAWVCTVLVVIAKSGPSHDFGGVPLVDWAIGVSAAISPVAMVWMITAYLQRAADIQTIADPLRRQLTLITGESGAADARIRRFNQAIREQIELLRNAQTISQDDLEAIMDRVRQHRSELERFESASTSQVKEIQDVLRRSMFQAEQMMDDKFTMLRVLDGKLQQNGDGVARQVEGVRDQIAKMLEEIEGTSVHMAEMLERAQRDSKKLSDTSRLQESSLTNAAQSAAETLGGLSSTIDLSVTRFLERASSAREEAERLANALDAQTRALDDFSTTLPVRVSEAESVLRGVADRLYASEQMAREQAIHLSEKLSQQVDGLQSFMDRFTARLSDIDTGLDRRQSDLNSLGERIGATTGAFISSWEDSLNSLNDRTGNSLLRFTVVNDETRRNAETVVAHLSETTSKYEDVVVRMRALSSDSNTQMKGMTEEISRQLSQFESLSNASAQAGEEVQERASAALQNLQHVLERVLTAREATQAVGETLVKDIYAAVDQNEKMINRLTETAQVSARAIAVASEGLSRQEGDLTTKAHANETILVEAMQKLQQQAEISGSGLREQTANLMGLLAEAQNQLATTDQKLQSFATTAVAPVQKAVQQIDTSADQGLRAITTYGEGLTKQVGRLEEFHTRIGGISEYMGKTTAETAIAFEKICERFASARVTQDETARQNLAQFSDLSDRLQREVAGLDGQSARAVELLQQAALKVGEQSYQMLENAQSSGAQIKQVTFALQTEAAQMQSILRQQSEEISADLARAEQKFTTLGETVRERADAAYALLDRTAAHFGSTTQTLSQDFETRIQNISATVGHAHSKVESLNAALSGQVEKIGVDASKIEIYASEIATSSGRAVQNLSALNDKMASAHETSVMQSAHTLNKIEECTSSFQRRTVDMAEAAETATNAVYKASAAFGEQAGRLVDGGQQIDAVLRQLTSATSALAEQAAQIRNGMEQQNSRLLSQLSDSVAQLDVTGNKLQQVVTVATQGADQASQRFTDMTETASKRIGGASQELQAMAERAEATLAALGVNVTQQAASLSVVGEQIGEQQRILAAANENQRAQMVDLFDKLGAAHKQASDVAERAIAHLTTSLQEINRQMGMVGDRSQEAVGVVKMASMGFSDQAVLLLQNAQAAEQQARTVLTVTSALQDQARHLRESLQAESERAGDSLGTLLNRLASGGAEVRELGVDTTAVFTGLQRALSEQTGELNTSMQQIGDRQRTLVASLDQQRETINTLLNRLVLAQDETAAAAERASLKLSDGAQQITRYTEALDARAQSALLTVRAATTGFAHEAEALETQARQAEVQTQAILASASGIHEQIHDLRLAIQEDGTQTTAALDGLLNKVTTGASEIRDLSATTEMSLISLGNNVTQQGAALSSTMQQIGERQRSLVGTLDAQRDVVNGLLNRLTLAQDETASSAERAAARINDGAQQITRQLDLIETQATSTLASVQASVSGFVDQAGVLTLQGQQAEQQMRGVLSVTAGMQDQARHLRESLQAESERAGDSLGTLLNRLASGGAEVRELGVDTTAVFTGLQRALSEQTGELNTSMQQIGDRQRTLVASLDQQRETINTLLNRLVLAQDETAAAAERASLKLSDGAQQITRYTEALDARAQSALLTVRAATTGFAHEAEALETQARQAEVQTQAILASASGIHEQIHDLRLAIQEDGTQTTAALDGLLNKVTTGASEIRDLSATTEMSLISLGNNVTQQGAALSSTMQQIGERQRSLVGTLDAQRDVVNGLLNRLTLAQDETASSAERAAARINDGAQQITRQLDLIETQATSTLASVQASVSGFVDQAGVLTLQGQQAEQQMRGVLSVTAGMQEQARHLREAMQVETSRAVEHLSEVIAQLDTANRQLKNESGHAIQTLDSSAQQFASATEAGAELIRKQAEILSQSAEQSEGRMNSAGEKIRNHLRLVSEIGDQAEAQASQLANAAEFATTRLVTLRDTLTVSDRDGREMVLSASQRIEEVKTVLQEQAQHLSALSQNAVEKVTEAAQNLATQSEALRANLAMSESAVAEAASQVREESSYLPTILSRNVSEIETATRSLKAQAHDADQTLIGTADRFISVTSTARESMIEEMQRVGSVAEAADKVLRHFTQTLGEQVAAIQQGSMILSSEQRDLVEKAGVSVSALTQASDRLTLLRDEAVVTAERLAHEFNVIDQRATATSTRLAQSSEGLAKQMDAMTEAAARAENQMSGVSDSFREQLERIRAGMQSQIDDINRGLMQITAQLERTGSSLRSTTVGAVADVERIGQRFEHTGGEAVAKVEARTQQMRTATDEVAKILSGFGNQFEQMLGTMAKAGDGIKRHEGDMVGQLQKMLSHLGTVAEKLEAARNLSGSVSQQTIERLDEIVNAVQAHMNNMTSSAQTAAGVMRGIGQIYNDQTQTLTKGVGEAHNQVVTMNKDIDAMQERTDRMRQALKAQGDDLMGSLRQILSQLEMTGDGLTEAVNRTLEQQATAGLQKIG